MFRPYGIVILLNLSIVHGVNGTLLIVFDNDPFIYLVYIL